MKGGNGWWRGVVGFFCMDGVTRIGCFFGGGDPLRSTGIATSCEYLYCIIMKQIQLIGVGVEYDEVPY